MILVLQTIPLELAQQLGLFGAGKPAGPSEPRLFRETELRERAAQAKQHVHITAHIRHGEHGYVAVHQHESERAKAAAHLETAKKFEASPAVEKPSHGSGQPPEEHVVDTKPRTIRVAADLLPSFQATMAKLGERAEKLGCEPPDYQVGAAYDYTRDVETVDDSGSHRTVKRTTRAVDITVTPKPIKLSGWALAGSVEIRPQQSPLWNVSDWAVGHIPERYRDAKPSCDHCALERKRKLLFIVKHAAGGEWKQVGGDCVKDFLGHDPSELAAMMGLYDSIRSAVDDFDGDNEGGGGGYQQSYHPLGEALALGIALSRIRGYVSGREAYEKGGQSTADTIRGLLSNEQHEDIRRELRTIRGTPQYRAAQAKVPEIIAWGKALPEGPLGSYEDKLRLAFQNEDITGEDVGIVVSALSAFERHATQLRLDNVQARAREVGFLGKPGDDIGTGKLPKKKRDAGVSQHPPRELFCLSTHTIQGQYGPTHILKFVDPEGHLLTWFSSKGSTEIAHVVKGTDPETWEPESREHMAAMVAGGETPNDRVTTLFASDVEPGNRYLLRGATIKAHDTYKGDPSTIITRGNLVPLPDELDLRSWHEPKSGYRNDAEREAREPHHQWVIDKVREHVASAAEGALRFEGT